MKQLFSTTLLLAALLTPLAMHSFPFIKDKKAAPATERALTLGQFHDRMRELWNDHGIWTREAVMGIIEDAPNSSVVVARLMKNQDDIGAAIATFYGAENGNKVAKLLKEHEKIAAEIVKAAKRGDTKEANKQRKLWYQNADEIALLLSSLNPHLTKDGTQKMLHDHLLLVDAYATARLKKQWEKDITSYDTFRAQLNHMADAISGAIALQFPAKFHKKTPWYKRNSLFGQKPKQNKA